jgi:hypothetical protein
MINFEIFSMIMVNIDTHIVHFVFEIVFKQNILTPFLLCIRCIWMQSVHICSFFYPDLFRQCIKIYLHLRLFLKLCYMHLNHYYIKHLCGVIWNIISDFLKYVSRNLFDYYEFWIVSLSLSLSMWITSIEPITCHGATIDILKSLCVVLYMYNIIWSLILHIFSLQILDCSGLFLT